MARQRFYRRRFLNRRGHHAGAYVLADITIDTWRSNGEECQLDAELIISDCSRVTTLTFDAYDGPSWSNALYKARNLQSVVNDFVEALEAAGEEIGLD